MPDANSSSSHAQQRSHLKAARNLHRWSQQEVADKIGSTALSVRRWERGYTSPNAYFRQKLCKLYNQTPSELGLLASDTSISPVITEREES